MHVTTVEGTHPTITPCKASKTQVQKNYVKVDTTCETKVKTTRGTQVLLLDGRLMKETHSEELNRTPLLYKGQDSTYLSPYPIGGTNLHRETM